MKRPIIPVIFLAGIVLAASTFSCTPREERVAPAAAVIPEMSRERQVIVYYFHGNYRCVSCTNIEKFARETVEADFSDQLRSGLLVFRAVNVEKPENQHFVKDYNLYTKSLVLSLVKDGREVRSVNLDKVWEYLRDRKRFGAYVHDGVAQYLEAIP